jgi:hypothetical protein
MVSRKSQVETGLSSVARFPEVSHGPTCSLSRLLEGNVELRQAYSLSKGMPSLTPTSTAVGDTNSADDSAKAVRLLAEMAAKNGRAFETEFADPANRKLANRT